MAGHCWKGPESSKEGEPGEGVRVACQGWRMNSWADADQQPLQVLGARGGLC